jgi:hypothetical protein
MESMNDCSSPTSKEGRGRRLRKDPMKDIKDSGEPDESLIVMANERSPSTGKRLLEEGILSHGDTAE